jgi:hypothetical protein
VMVSCCTKNGVCFCGICRYERKHHLLVSSAVDVSCCLCDVYFRWELKPLTIFGNEGAKWKNDQILFERGNRAFLKAISTQQGRLPSHRPLYLV